MGFIKGLNPDTGEAALWYWSWENSAFQGIVKQGILILSLLSLTRNERWINMSSFFKKMGETMANTAAQVGSMSADLVNAGKSKVDQIQLESKAKNLKIDIGNLVYEAYTQGTEPNSQKIVALCAEIKQIEENIAQLNSPEK